MTNEADEKPYRVKCRVAVFATAYVKAKSKNEAERKVRDSKWLAISIEDDTAIYDATESIEDDV